MKDDYNFFLGRHDSKQVSTDILHCCVYKSTLKKIIEDGKELDVLDLKMKIEKKDLLFIKTENGIDVWSKIDQGEHAKNETSIIFKSKSNSFFRGENWRGMILRED